MQIDAIVEDADAPVLVDVATGNQHVAIAPDEVDAVPDLANDGPDNRQLHGAFRLDAVGQFVGADDLDPLNHRRSLPIPDGRLERRGIGGPVVSPDESNGGARSGHDDFRGPVAGECRVTGSIEIDDNCLADQEIAFRQMNRPDTGIDRTLKCVSIVGPSIACQPEGQGRLDRLRHRLSD